MLSEEQVNKIMADIVWFSTDKEIWGGILEHLYDLHKIRDDQLFNRLATLCRDEDEQEAYFKLRSMNYAT